MKSFRASIDVMPHDNLLDPQGKAVGDSMPNLGLDMISRRRIGKHITLIVEAKDNKGRRSQGGRGLSETARQQGDGEV